MSTNTKFNPEELKVIVKEKYGRIASTKKAATYGACCNKDKDDEAVDYTIFSDDYTKLEGYHPDADLNLGCGVPTEYAGLAEGQHVLDLGSGAGNDCFIARSIVGETGHVTGLDFTEQMVRKAENNLAKTTFRNINFVIGDIENMPFEENKLDVVISNCVLNLVPDKRKAFSEIFRVLKPGGHFCISDVVLKGVLPEKLLNEAEMYAGCVAGALQKEEYLNIISNIGFQQVEVKREKMVSIPQQLLENYLSGEEIENAKRLKTGIISMTVFGIKPLL